METTNAAVLYQPGDLRYEAVSKPQINNGKDVLVKIKAVGICGSDLDRVLHTGTYTFPTIPGHEFSGEVEEVGDEVSGLKPGDPVVVAPMLPCMKCNSCVKGNYGQCENYDFIGSRRDGAFAEYVVAPCANVIKMPEAVSFEEGALVEPSAVTLHGMMNVKINPGETVVVLGCGTIGQLAIQFSKIMGATKVIAVDINDGKLNEAKHLGADMTVNTLRDDVEEFVKTNTNNKGADVTIETAGTPITQEQCFRTTRDCGRILLLGTAHKDVVLPAKTFERIVRGELSVTGSWNSYSAPFPGSEWLASLSYIQQGKLNVESLISHKFHLSEAPQVFQKIKNREISFNKILFINK